MPSKSPQNLQLRFTDLDERPDLSEEVLALYRRFGPGRFHAVNGEPSAMGQEPQITDLYDCLGVLVAMDGNDQVAGALAICPYSSSQVTLWGPVVASGHQGYTIGPRLLDRARQALREGGFESVRVLNDTRNRRARAFFLSHGMAPWKDNHLYERQLDGTEPMEAPGVALARLSDHSEVGSIIMTCFPDSSHCDVSLFERERQGYRHYILQASGNIVAVAAVKGLGRRSWLSLYAVHPRRQGKGYGTTLIQGLIGEEYRHGVRSIGLEVLADNTTAIRVYERVGFVRRWTASILVGPL
ncbi:MAG: GNAT family N-acetyltransferase [Planctomycetota bacterium]|nr:MAG: GNAT family N-acetyltransferase [Planctomycetota bacterium]